jgi:hypothetical protein
LRLSLARARSIAEFARTGYLIFGITVVVTTGLFEWQVQSTPSLQPYYDSLRATFLALLESVKLGSLPTANKPIVFLAVVAMVGLFFIEKTRLRIGTASGDIALRVLGYMVKTEEALIKRRTLSTFLLAALLVAFYSTVASYTGSVQLKRRVDDAGARWLALVRTSVLGTTMVPEDAARYQTPLAFWNQSALAAADKNDPRSHAGTGLHQLINGVYAAIGQDTSLCAVLPGVLDSSYKPSAPVPRSHFVASVEQLARVVRARANIHLLLKSCSAPELYLRSAKESLDGINDPDLAAAKANLLGLVYSNAWRLWMRPGGYPGDQVCRSPEACIEQGYYAYTSTNSGSSDDYEELKRRNNVLDFLVEISAADMKRLTPSSISWLRSWKRLPDILERHLKDLEQSPNLHRLGGYIPYLTLSQAYGALATARQDSVDDLKLRRSAAYLAIAAAINVDATFKSTNPARCKPWKASPSTFQKALKEPVDRSIRLKDALEDCL